MAMITVKGTVTVRRTKTVKINVLAKDVKEWLRDNYGTPSEHGYEWDEDHILMEYLDDVEPTMMVDLEAVETDDEEIGIYELESAERDQ
tara:strand:- start:134 stop:400 length:267 start_codon:yes stop_codon:yes gene_type:complete